MMVAMRYKDFIWPHNPETYEIYYTRQVVSHKAIGGRYQLQELGLSHRVMEGEGVFYGADAYDTFKELAVVFYQSGSGLLIHPVWQSANVYFKSLSLAQEPQQDYVRYTFTFWEDYSNPYTTLQAVSNGSDGMASTTSTTESSTSRATELYHTVVQGDTLWGIAVKYDVSLSTLIDNNPEIVNPNLIYPGQKVKVQ